MAERIESLLTVVATAQSTSDLSQATTELATHWFKQPDTIPVLLHIITTSVVVPVRQLAAVEARKLIEKNSGKAWLALQEPVREGIKAGILNITVNEANNLVRHALARVIAEIAKIEIDNQRWVELVEALHRLCNSPVASQREVGVYVLYSLFEVIADQLAGYLPELLTLFCKTVNDQESLAVAVTTVQALGKLAEFIEDSQSQEFKLFRDVLPAMVQVLHRVIAAGDDDSALKIFEVFESFLLLEVPVISKHFADIMNVYLVIAQNDANSDELRNMALSFVMLCILYARNRIQKLGLIGPIINAAMPVTAAEEPGDRDEQYPAKVALQVISSLSTTFPPQHVYPAVMQHAVGYLQSADPGHRRGAMLAIAVLVEGCATYMGDRLEEILPLIYHALQDADPTVRRAACTSIGSLAEELGEEIAEEHATLMPILLALADDQDEEIQPVVLAALDVLAEALEDNVMVYIDTLMNKLIAFLASANRKAALSAAHCIGSVACAAGTNFAPYFEVVMSRLHTLMSLEATSDLDARAVATDAIGAVAEAMGKEAFTPYMTTIMDLAIKGIHIDNSQLREHSYALFGVLARVFKEEFSPFLSLVVPQILLSCNLEDKDWNSMLNVKDDDAAGDEEDLDGDDDDDEAGGKLTFNSAVSQEKESSLDALSSLFSATKVAFLPYVQESVNAALSSLQNFNENVRTSAAQCLLRFFATVASMANPGEWEAGLPLKTPLHENVVSIGTLTMDAVLTMLEEEEARMVVIKVLQELCETIKTVGPAALSFSFTESPREVPQHLDTLANLLLLIFRKEHMCQVSEDYEASSGHDEEELAELDALLLGYAGDVLGAMTAALGAPAAHYVAAFLPLVAKLCQKSRPVTDRSMGIGIIAEVVEGLDHGVTQFTADLMALFVRSLKDEDDEVRSNAAYAVGVLVANTTMDVSSSYPQLLQLLHPLFTVEDSSAANLVDNACSALARMILKNASAVPLEQVLPVMLAALPIKQDHQENASIFKCIFALLDAHNPAILAHLPRLAAIFREMVDAPEAHLDSATRSRIVAALQALQ